MGACSSGFVRSGQRQHDASRGDEGVGVLIRSATGLRNADACFAGQSDPYVVVRFGYTGSSWWEKTGVGNTEQLEWQSRVVRNTASPTWLLAFQAYLPPRLWASGWEMHIKVYDEDNFSADDDLGQVVLTQQALVQHVDEERRCELVGRGAAPGSSVTVLVGPKVEELMRQELKQDFAASGTSHCFIAPPTMPLLSAFFGFAPTYYYNLAVILRAMLTPLTPRKDPTSEFFTKMTTDSKTGENTFVWNGFTANSTMLTGHAECSRQLAEMRSRLGKDAANNGAYRRNFIGLFKASSVACPEVPWRCLALNAPAEAHTKLRTVCEKLLGPNGKWSHDLIRNRVKEFFFNRDTLTVPSDFAAFGTNLLHEVLTGIKLSDEDLEEFVSLTRSWRLLLLAPAALTDLDRAGFMFDQEKTLAMKQEYMRKLRAVLPSHLPEAARMSRGDLIILASAVFEMLAINPTQITQILSISIAIPFSQWGDESFPVDFRFCDLSNVPGYVWEVIRKFPPVPAVHFVEMSRNNTPDRQVFLNLMMAQQDPRVWGPSAGEFRPRPIHMYHKFSVGFAEEPAGSPEASPATRRTCPARDLVLATSVAFVSEFVQTVLAAGGDASSKDAHRKVWSAHAHEAGGNGKLKPLDCSEIKLSLAKCSDFVLCKVRKAAVCDAQSHSTAEPEDGSESAEPTEDTGEVGDPRLAKAVTPQRGAHVLGRMPLPPTSRPPVEAIASAMSVMPQRSAGKVDPKRSRVPLSATARVEGQRSKAVKPRKKPET